MRLSTIGLQITDKLYPHSQIGFATTKTIIF